jgi:hypothetical protein
MALTAIAVEGFGGLNLAADPQDVGWAAATDLLNVDFDTIGRVRTRNGAALVSASPQTNGIKYLVPLMTGTRDLAAVGVGEVNRYSTGGAKTAGGTWAAGSVTRPAKIGTPTTAEIVYIASTGTVVNTGQTLRKYDGTTLSTSSGKPQYVAEFPGQNRLAQAGYYAAADSPSGANGSAATIFFSDAGAPDTYTATSFVTVDPGDGESFVGLVPWQNELLLFKGSKMYDFYGVGTQADGTPEFNYRRVTLPDLIPYTFSPTASKLVAPGPDGVYFLGTTGLWRTTGGNAVRVRTPVDAIFDGSAPASMVPDFNIVQLGWAGDRMYMQYGLVGGGVGSTRVLVWDRVRDAWTLWAFPDDMTALPVLAGAGTIGSTLFYAADDSTGNVYKLTPGQSTDNGTAITWRYQSGYSAPPGAGGRRVKLRGSSVWGTATNPVTLQVLTQGGRVADVADPGGTVTLGASPTVAEGKRRRSTRGVLFAHKLSGTGPATISRLTHRFLPPGFDS